MRIFLYEFTCSNPRTLHHVLASLRKEGAAMLAALLDDFGRLPGCEIVTLKHSEDETAFRSLARNSDFTLAIAPELEHTLFNRCRWVEEEGGRLLGSSSSAVCLIGDKFTLARHLNEKNMPTPDCRHFDARLSLADLVYPVVWKPRFGAGSTATFLISHRGEWPERIALARAEGWQGESVVQPFISGQPASVTFLVGRRQTVALLPATQELSQDGRFHYLGGRLPLAKSLARRAVLLARRAVDGIPGLLGFLGVDLILGKADDGSEDKVIEINPRLTTSYLGLRALAQFNLADIMLLLVEGKEIPDLTWLPGSVRFTPIRAMHTSVDSPH